MVKGKVKGKVKRTWRHRRFTLPTTLTGGRLVLDIAWSFVWRTCSIWATRYCTVWHQMTFILSFKKQRQSWINVTTSILSETFRQIMEKKLVCQFQLCIRMKLQIGTFLGSASVPLAGTGPCIPHTGSAWRGNLNMKQLAWHTYDTYGIQCNINIIQHKNCPTTCLSLGRYFMFNRKGQPEGW